MAMVFCRGCKAEIHETAPTCPHCGAPQGIQISSPYPLTHSPNSEKKTNTFNLYLDVLKKYATFSGRSQRNEFWYYQLYNWLIQFILLRIDHILHSKMLLILYFFVTIIPSLAVCVRRMHDTGRNGFWILLPLVNLIFFLEDTQKGDNKYGTDPKANIR